MDGKRADFEVSSMYLCKISDKESSACVCKQKEDVHKEEIESSELRVRRVKAVMCIREEYERVHRQESASVTAQLS